MLDAAKTEVIRIAKSITPEEGCAWTMATLYGRENVPAEYEKALTETLPKLVNIGWIVYTQLMAEGMKPETPKATKRKRVAKKTRVAKKK